VRGGPGVASAFGARRVRRCVWDGSCRTMLVPRSAIPLRGEGRVLSRSTASAGRPCVRQTRRRGSMESVLPGLALLACRPSDAPAAGTGSSMAGPSSRCPLLQRPSHLIFRPATHLRGLVGQLAECSSGRVSPLQELSPLGPTAHSSSASPAAVGTSRSHAPPLLARRTISTSWLARQDRHRPKVSPPLPV
jgi:hypothetical protein